MCRILLFFILISTATALQCISGIADANANFNRTTVNCSNPSCSYGRNFAANGSLENTVYACQTYNYTKECKKNEHHRLTSYICHCKTALCNDQNEMKQKMDKFIVENPAQPKTYEFDHMGNVVEESNTTLKCYSGRTDDDGNIAKSIVRCGEYGAYSGHLGCSYVRNFAANGVLENTVYACQTFNYTKDSECKKAEHHGLTSYICHCETALCNDQNEIKQKMDQFIEENPAQPKNYEFVTEEYVTDMPRSYEYSIGESSDTEGYGGADSPVNPIASESKDTSEVTTEKNQRNTAIPMIFVVFSILLSVI